MNINFKQIKKFLLSGGGATLVHYVSMISLIYLSVTPVVATIIGAILGATANYIFQYYYTFESKKSHFKTLSRYTITILFSFLTNAIIFALLYENLHFHIVVSQVLATMIVTLQNFILYKYLVFLDKVKK